MEQQKAALGNIQFAFLTCIISIFFVLVILFNSLTQPFLIMIVIPFGLSGIIIGFSLQGIEMSFLALIGVLGLIGVLVNDSLVMVAPLNRLKIAKAADSALAKPIISDLARLPANGAYSPEGGPGFQCSNKSRVHYFVRQKKLKFYTYKNKIPVDHMRI